MSTDVQSEIAERKRGIREQAHKNRNAVEDKDGLSRIICDKFVALPEYESADTVMYYVDVRSEVRTRQHLPMALESDKRIVIPYCVEGELELFWLESMDELAVGMYRILEPLPELRTVARKRVDVRDLDLVMVPGVAFDRRGARMGHGMGYYDKLLHKARPDAPLVALAFECQLFAEVPTDKHDIFMDKILTEQAVYLGRGRRAHG